jgi:WD40 repeat protein
VWVINRDGTGAKMIFQSADPLLAMDMIAWSPDGRSVAVELQNGVAYLIVADCADSPAGCTESARAEIQAFPDHWRHTFYPQWAGEVASSVAQCRIVFVGYQGNYNVHVRNCDGSGVQQVTDLVTEVSAPEHPVWSPDGQAILFVSRHEGNKLSNSTGEPCTSLYVIRPDGAGLARWTRDRCDDQPSWSPDGTRIAFHRECDLAVMNLDGTGISIIAKPHADLYCIDQSAWSPDGQRIAFTSLKWPSLGLLAEQAVFVVDPDGSNLTQLATVPAENWVEYSVAWSSDGDQIAFSVVQDGLEQYYSVNSDGSSEPTRINEIPESWYLWYWPQWEGEAQAATSTPVSMAEQARAFAGPILQAIANRKPDFEDDFSTADKDWKTGFGLQSRDGTLAIEDGVARMRLGNADAYFANMVLNQKDFVLQVEARLAAGDAASQMAVAFHVLTPDYGYKVTLNSKLRAWSFDKAWGEFSQPAKGSGDVSPVGEATRIVIVARGPHVAIYLNGAPVAYLDDADFDTSGQTLLICTSTSQSICEFDNVKLWRLDNVPGLP